MNKLFHVLPAQRAALLALGFSEGQIDAFFTAASVL